MLWFVQDGRISYEEFVIMMKTGTDWRKASRQYSRERFKSLSVNLMKDGSLRLEDKLTGQSVAVWGNCVSALYVNLELLFLAHYLQTCTNIAYIQACLQTKLFYTFGCDVYISYRKQQCWIATFIVWNLELVLGCLDTCLYKNVCYNYNSFSVQLEELSTWKLCSS